MGIRSQYNFSVEPYQGQWIMRAIMPYDVEPSIDEHFKAIEMLREQNKRKFVNASPTR